MYRRSTTRKGIAQGAKENFGENAEVMFWGVDISQTLAARRKGWGLFSYTLDGRAICFIKQYPLAICLTRSHSPLITSHRLSFLYNIQHFAARPVKGVSYKMLRVLMKFTFIERITDTEARARSTCSQYGTFGTFDHAGWFDVLYRWHRMYIFDIIQML